MTPGVGYRGQVLLQPWAHHLVPLRQHQSLAEAGGVLVYVEARVQGGDLKQNTARLPEVDRPEIGAIDDRCRVQVGAAEGLAPGLMVLVRRSPGYVVHAPSTLDRADARWRIDKIARAASRGRVLEDSLMVGETEDPLEQVGGVLGPGGVGPDAGEAQKCVVLAYAFSDRAQRRAAEGAGSELQAEPLGVFEAERGILPIDADPLTEQPHLP